MHELSIHVHYSTSVYNSYLIIISFFFCQIIYLHTNKRNGAIVVHISVKAMLILSTQNEPNNISFMGLNLSRDIPHDIAIGVDK